MATNDVPTDNPGPLGHPDYWTVTLTPAEAAKRLGLGQTKFYELLDRKEIRSILVGRSRRIPLGCLAEFVERQLAYPGDR